MKNLSKGISKDKCNMSVDVEPVSITWLKCELCAESFTSQERYIFHRHKHFESYEEYVAYMNRNSTVTQDETTEPETIKSSASDDASNDDDMSVSKDIHEDINEDINLIKNHSTRVKDGSSLIERSSQSSLFQRGNKELIPKTMTFKKDLKICLHPLSLQVMEQYKVSKGYSTADTCSQEDVTNWCQPSSGLTHNKNVSINISSKTKNENNQNSNIPKENPPKKERVKTKKYEKCHRDMKCIRKRKSIYKSCDSMLSDSKTFSQELDQTKLRKSVKSVNKTCLKDSSSCSNNYNTDLCSSAKVLASTGECDSKLEVQVVLSEDNDVVTRRLPIPSTSSVSQEKIQNLKNLALLKQQIAQKRTRKVQASDILSSSSKVTRQNIAKRSCNAIKQFTLDVNVSVVSLQASSVKELHTNTANISHQLEYFDKNTPIQDIPQNSPTHLQLKDPSINDLHSSETPSDKKKLTDSEMQLVDLKELKRDGLNLSDKKFESEAVDFVKDVRSNEFNLSDESSKSEDVNFIVEDGAEPMAECIKISNISTSYDVPYNGKTWYSPVKNGFNDNLTAIVTPKRNNEGDGIILSKGLECTRGMKLSPIKLTPLNGYDKSDSGKDHMTIMKDIDDVYKSPSNTSVLNPFGEFCLSAHSEPFVEMESYTGEIIRTLGGSNENIVKSNLNQSDCHKYTVKAGVNQSNSGQYSVNMDLNQSNSCQFSTKTDLNQSDVGMISVDSLQALKEQLIIIADSPQHDQQSVPKDHNVLNNEAVTASSIGLSDTHLALYSPQKEPLLHQCKTCNKRFRSKETLTQHASLHGHSQPIAPCMTDKAKSDTENENNFVLVKGALLDTAEEIVVVKSNIDDQLAKKKGKVQNERAKSTKRKERNILEQTEHIRKKEQKRKRKHSEENSDIVKVKKTESFEAHSELLTCPLCNVGISKQSFIQHKHNCVPCVPEPTNGLNGKVSIELDPRDDTSSDISQCSRPGLKVVLKRINGVSYKCCNVSNVRFDEDDSVTLTNQHFLSSEVTSHSTPATDVNFYSEGFDFLKGQDVQSSFTSHTGSLESFVARQNLKITKNDYVVTSMPYFEQIQVKEKMNADDLDIFQHSNIHEKSDLRPQLTCFKIDDGDNCVVQRRQIREQSISGSPWKAKNQSIDEPTGKQTNKLCGVDQEEEPFLVGQQVSVEEKDHDEVKTPAMKSVSLELTEIMDDILYLSDPDMDMFEDE